LAQSPAPASAGGLAPRKSPDAYPARATSSRCTLAAEFQGRSAPGAAGVYFTGDYVVVEVGVFPAAGQAVEVRAADLRLRVNGARLVLSPANGALAATGVREREQRQRESGLHTDVAVGPILIPGTSRRDPNFPGDPTGPQPLPHPAPSGKPEIPGDEQPPPLALDAALLSMELRDGARTQPRAGCLYFYYPGKLKS
jgi:hypothetical protein